MRVLILSWEYPPLIEGGLARHVRKLSENLASQGALGERAGGVDREHAHLALVRARVPDERADQSALAHPGRSGETDVARVAGLRIDGPDQLPAGRVIVLHERDAAGERPLVSRHQALGERRIRALPSGLRFHRGPMIAAP